MADSPKNTGDVEITPEMMEAGRKVFDEWMMAQDYLAEGAPSDYEVSTLLRVIFSSMIDIRPIPIM